MLGAGFVADQHTFADYVKTFGFADRAEQLHFRDSVNMTFAFLRTDKQPCVSFGMIKFLNLR